MFLLYSLSLGAPIWPILVGGPRVHPVRAHSSYATESDANLNLMTFFLNNPKNRRAYGKHWNIQRHVFECERKVKSEK
jgi:hypothetical protein